MGNAQALTVRQARDPASAVRLLGRAAAHDVDAITGSVAAMVEGCALFEVIDATGQAVGAFALRVDDYPDGRALTVTAAAATTASGATETMAAWCEAQARDHIRANVLTCTTARPGLVRRLKRAGFSVAGYVLKKEI